MERTPRSKPENPTRIATAYLHITRPSIKIQVEILNLPKLCKLILDILLRGFFVDVGY
jgi:hypothetical protein